MVASVAIGYLLGSSTTTLNSNIDNTKTMIDKDEDTNNIDELLWNGIALYHINTNYRQGYYTYIPNYVWKIPLATMKMLEIGLGCDMNYAPGASVALYKKLFLKADLWEAEYDGECVKKSIEKGELDGINTLVGDQGNDIVLDSWIEQSGGNLT